jgi:NTE family protein
MSEAAQSEGDTTADADDPTRVAIACQGGGSHTAFTAGVLRELLGEWDDDHELVGISGTSGGAFNALVAWYGLLSESTAAPETLLADLWDDLAADGVGGKLANDWLVALNRLGASGLPLPQFSPYQVPGSDLSTEFLRDILERHVDFDEVPALCGPETPELVVGTVDINAGVFETFTNAGVTPQAVLASAAVPTLFEAVEIDGHYHWDGLFSQNPPIDDLLTVDADRKPEQLWVIQVNPQKRESEPQTLEEIADRRNELAGNISLNQELGVVRRVNEWLEAGHLPESDFQHTEIRRISMGDEYHCSTKLDRSPEFVAELIERGEQRAREFRRGE